MLTLRFNSEKIACVTKHLRREARVEEDDTVSGGGGDDIDGGRASGGAGRAGL